MTVEPRDGHLCVFMPPVERARGLSRAARRGRGGGQSDRPAGADRGLSRRPPTRASMSSASRPIPASSRSTSIPPRTGASASRRPPASTRRRGSRAARRRQVHDRRPAYRHRRRQPCRGRRRDAARQPVPAPPRSAEEPGRSTGSATRRCPTCSPACSSGRRARRRASTKRATTRSTSSRSRWRRCRGRARAQRRRPGWSTACSATSSSTSPATRIAPRSASTSSIRPTAPTGRLGLVEFRGFEMPPNARMSLAQQLLVRALIARLWREPLDGELVRWGTALHDRFMLPHFVWEDFLDVLADLTRAWLRRSEPEWFEAQPEFRFPFCGEVEYEGVKLELRQALEPWHVMGETGRDRRHGALRRFLGRAAAGQADDGRSRALRRRLQRPPRAADAERRPAGVAVAGVRYKAWQPAIGAASDAAGRRAAHLRHLRHAGPAARSAAASTMSPIRAAATTRPSRSTPTRPRRAASPASRRTATRPAPTSRRRRRRIPSSR